MSSNALDNIFETSFATVTIDTFAWKSTSELATGIIKISLQFFKLVGHILYFHTCNCNLE